MKKFPLTQVALYGVPVLIVGGIIWAIIASPNGPDGTNPASGGPDTTGTLEDLVQSCTTDMFTTFHIHPNLTIYVNGAKQTIPANIGITNSCMHPIHTHDDSGKIHVESPEQRDFTLGDFFLVWGKPFDATHLLDQTVDDSHTIVMTVNGVANTQFEKYVMHDGDNIVLSYESK